MQITFIGDAADEIRKQVSEIVESRRLPLRAALEILKRDRNIHKLAKRLGFDTGNGESI